MKSRKLPAIALALVLTAVCAVGTITAFAADGNAEVAAQATVPVQQLSLETKDLSAKKDKFANKDKSGTKTSFDKGSMIFVGINAVAAEVLGVSEESLAGLNHTDELYAKLVEAGKVAEQLRAAGYGDGIVFLTESKSYGPDSFRVNALDYLVKPIMPDKVRGAIHKAEKRRGAVCAQ